MSGPQSRYLLAHIHLATIVPIPKSLVRMRLVIGTPFPYLIVYIIFSKILFGRLSILISQIVSPQQGGFIKGSGTFSNTLQAQLTFAWVAIACHSGLVLKIDYYKGYDCLNHDFRFALIRKAGLGPKFAQLVNMLYSDTPTYIVINGIASYPFIVGRGVRQGCPLTPLLYALAT